MKIKTPQLSVKQKVFLKNNPELKNVALDIWKEMDQAKLIGHDIKQHWKEILTTMGQ